MKHGALILLRCLCDFLKEINVNTDSRTVLDVQVICVTCQAVEALSYDEEMCARIIHTQLHVDMLSNLRCVSLTSTTLSDCQTQFIDTLLRTLINIVRNSATGRSSLSPCLDIVHKFCKLTAYPVSFYRIFILY